MKYTKHDCWRVQKVLEDATLPPEDYRSDWRRDYARLIHSPAFRRLQGKTQLFPGFETDFFRNRLTHSLEVAQIGKSIAIKLNDDLQVAGTPYRIEPDLVEFAGLAHDLGHPPFGHIGEDILDELMAEAGGFEGNAQTLRIITKIEKRNLIESDRLGISSTGQDKRVGLNLTARSIASVLKYDRAIAAIRKGRKGQHGPTKGYYQSEGDLVKQIKNKITEGKPYTGDFKTIECQIMDIADDIAYSTYDIEDSFKAGFLQPVGMICASKDVLNAVIRKVNANLNTSISLVEARERIRAVFGDNFDLPDGFEELFENCQDRNDIKKRLDATSFYYLDSATRLSTQIASNGYYRTRLTSKLVGSAIRKVSISKIDDKIPALSKVELERDKRIDVEILKHLVFESQIMSPKVQIGAIRSREIVETIFATLTEPKGYLLLPEDYRIIYLAFKSPKNQLRTICDFIAGMTDRYALEFYGRLVSENPQTIFKPI